MKTRIVLMSMIIGVWANLATATPVWFGKPHAARVLRINSSLDLASFAPLLERFVALNPDIRVSYLDVNTFELYQKTILEKNNPSASLVISSAMDLQLKLINDGYGQTYTSPVTAQLPSDAKWRDQVFAFSLEPVVMLVNKDQYPGKLPQDRQDLLRTIRQYEEQMTGKIGTYDIRRSGVGYLLASQDARQADATWGRLIEAFGSHQLQTYCCTHEIIDDVASGKLLLGYNLLGSYASQRARLDSRLEMILPKDYTLMVMRVALIPKHASNKGDAGRFLDFLLSNEVQGMMQTKALLFPIRPDVTPVITPYVVEATGPKRAIELDQQLLVGRDYAKQRRFISSWEIAQEMKPK
ncbi:ABC transporter substrate-binding protein [Marinomonas pollencensis]|uniref:Iron(III) transport system substrate-binding protein n=1 Tax=Marinomonas pollencensis TaxID=491954 RepID=A0A3E0DU65_9GAMM|nr:ABC transporter substrate-binding protein [Marinomonas pollencensis]REG86448.1 iron(III) transport system substrate-binding protein [Marinomonas pollencensis]